MKKILLLLIAASIAFTSCDKDFGDLNVDKKRPSEVAPGALFTTAQKRLMDLMTTPDVNSNIFRYIAQYWTETTYIDEVNYDLDGRSIPQNFWNTMYVNVLKNLKEAQSLIPSQDDAFYPAVVKANENACAEILNVYAFSTLVNTYGDIPYSEALDFANALPKYDNAATVYEDLLKAGVVDPTKVVRTCLQNAASISGLLLITEAAVADAPEKEDEGHGHSH